MLTPPGAALAVLFAAGEPLEREELAKLLDIPEDKLESVLAALRDMLKVAGLALVETGEELELRTAPEADSLVQKLWEDERSRDLGKAGLETLAVIAYQGGATRGEVDWVRGVNSSASIRTLLLRGLIEGKEDPADKRRIRYTLTSVALAHLGVARLADLPRYKELASETEAHLAAANEGEPAAESAT